MADFASCLHYAKMKMGIFYTLKPEQVQTLQDLWNGIDTVAILPTGFGKSIIYQLLPYLIQKKTGAAEPMIAIVVAPLNSIMEDQVQCIDASSLWLIFTYIHDLALVLRKYKCIY